MKKDKLTYSSAITELEEIVNEIESGEVDVDVLTAKVKRASELIKFCKDNLRDTQKEVNKVLEGMEAKEGDADEEDKD
jgi:exodeoxyribonuclease VII small subunit